MFTLILWLVKAKFFYCLRAYFSLHQEYLDKTAFLTPGVQLRNAAQTFAQQVGEITKRKYEMV